EAKIVHDDVARGAGRKRATAQSGQRCIEATHTTFKSGRDVCQASTPRVMKVSRNRQRVKLRHDCLKDSPDLNRIGIPDRIGYDDLVGACRGELQRILDYIRDGHASLVRASQSGGQSAYDFRTLARRM